jgi:hypothetical protein
MKMYWGVEVEIHIFFGLGTVPRITLAYNEASIITSLSRLIYHLMLQERAVTDDTVVAGV